LRLAHPQALQWLFERFSQFLEVGSCPQPCFGSGIVGAAAAVERSGVIKCSSLLPQSTRFQPHQWPLNPAKLHCVFNYFMFQISSFQVWPLLRDGGLHFAICDEKSWDIGT
jgi:hypothetical protein